MSEKQLRELLEELYKIYCDTLLSELCKELMKDLEKEEWYINEKNI